MGITKSDHGAKIYSCDRMCNGATETNFPPTLLFEITLCLINSKVLPIKNRLMRVCNKKVASAVM